jgi:diguanylate cyclase (GGDEF)-like protein/PAS domain S-box-containing protein
MTGERSDENNDGPSARRSGRVASALRHPIVVNYGFSILAFLAAICLTAWVWQLAIHNETVADKAQFRRLTRQAASQLRDRFTGYATLVRSGQAFFASSNHVTADEWRTFVRSLALQSHYAAVVAFDYLADVPDKRLGKFEARARHDRAGFHLRDVGPQSLHCIARFEAPLRDNSPFFGVDACADAKVLAMMRKTIESDDIAISRRVELDTRPLEDDTGVIMSGAVPGKSESAAPRGWVSIVLAVHRVFEGLLPDNSSVQMRVTDKNARATMLEDTRQGDEPLLCPSSPFLTSCLEKKIVVGLPGRQWTLVFSRPGGVVLAAWKVLAAGVFISFLLALLLLRWGRNRTHALALAREMTGALRESEGLLKAVTNNIFEGIYRGTPEEGLVYLNATLASMFGYDSAEEMQAVPGAILYADPEKRKELIQLLERQDYYRDEEVEFVRRDGSRFTGMNNAVAIRDARGRVTHWDGAIRDITASKAAERRVWYLARYDSLTGLANRPSFREKLRQEINRAARANGGFAVLFLNLDRFKVINDYLGHNIGDKLLQAVAKRIGSGLADDDVACRQGGDEFLMLLCDVTDAASAERRAAAILQAVARSYTIDAHDVSITPSVGVSRFPGDGQGVEELIKKADIAMYNAKQRGRFNVQLFQPEMNAERVQRAGLENDLREALHQHQFVLHYQPQVDIATGRIIAAEALLRWEHPGRGTIPPDEFVPVAEQSGLIVPIGEWVLNEACRQSRAWQRDGLAIVPVSVNISAVQFLRRTIDRTVLGALEGSGLDPRFLELELTETVVMQDTERAVEVIDKLRRAGVHFAIDDFGTGYSSLNYLRWFRINKLKIDQSFVRDMARNPDDIAIIDAIIGLAESFRLRVVAEGVETAQELDILEAHGCDDVQGFYFSRPVPADSFAELLEAGEFDGQARAAGGAGR